MIALVGRVARQLRHQLVSHCQESHNSRDDDREVDALSIASMYSAASVRGGGT